MRRTLRAAVCLLPAFLAAIAPVTVDALDPHKEPSQYGLKSFQAQRGSANGGILCIAQSADGYLWLGTRRGLVRFNGVEFRLFDSAASGGLIGRNVYHIETRADNSILFSTEDGAGLVELRNGKFSRHSTPPLPSRNIRIFHEERDGTLWIGTTGYGLIRVANGKTAVFAAAQGFGDEIKAILESRDGSIWIGAYRNGVTHYSNGQATHYGIEQGLPSNDVRAILEDPDGTLWFSTLGGLARCRAGKFTTFGPKDGLSHDRIFPLLRDRNGNLWIGTEGGGLNRMADGRFTALSATETLASGEIRAVFEDREGNIWFGDAEGTLHRLKDERFTLFTRHEGLSSDLVRAVLEDRAGTIWIGTAQGVNQLRDDRIVDPHVSWEAGAVTTMIQDRDGGFWIGTLRQGLRWVHKGHIQAFFPHRRITALLEDGEGDIWAGIGPGLARIRKGQPAPLDRHMTLDPSQARISALARDDRGGVWAAEVNGALHYLASSGSATYSLTAGGCSSGVTSLHADGQGTLWIGTSEGLCAFRNGVIEHYSTGDGLAENQISSMLEDDQGFLWLSGYEGFSRVSKNALRNYRRGTGSKLPVWFVERANGRATSSGFQMPAAAKAHDGRLWFASLRGLIMIDPASVRPDPLVPTVIEEVVADRKPLVVSGSASSPARLAASTRELEFRFVGLSLGDPGGVRFRYRLDGYDTDWTEAGDRRTAFYTNLPANSYQFRVMASNDDGVWNSQTATVAFIKESHIWETWWMRLLFVCTLGGACWIAYTTRVASLNRQFQAVLAERNRIARELHDTLEQGLTGVMLQLDTVAVHWSGAPAAARGGLDLARNMARHCIGEARAAVRDLRSQTADRGNALEALREMAQGFTTPAGLPEIRVEAEGDPFPLARNVEMTLLRIGQEALTNAVKHAHATRIALEVQFSPTGIRLRVSDDGVGFAAESSLASVASGHFGLLGMRERANKVGGKLVILSSSGGGTTVDFQLAQGTVEK